MKESKVLCSSFCLNKSSQNVHRTLEFTHSYDFHINHCQPPHLCSSFLAILWEIVTKVHAHVQLHTHVCTFCFSLSLPVITGSCMRIGTLFGSCSILNTCYRTCCRGGLHQHGQMSEWSLISQRIKSVASMQWIGKFQIMKRFSFLINQGPRQLLKG